MVGHDPKGDIGLFVLAVGARTDRRGLIDDGREQVGVEDRIMTLEDAENPLEPCPGIDVLVRQFAEAPVGGAVHLHEDEIPQFDESGIGPEFGAPVLAVGGPLVDEDLRVRAARTGVAHAPEIVGVAHALDPALRHPDLINPDLFRFVVAVVDGDPEAVAIETEGLGQEIPGHGDGVLLEIVAETEVAQHLEERAVIRCRSQ